MKGVGWFASPTETGTFPLCIMMTQFWVQVVEFHFLPTLVWSTESICFCYDEKASVRNVFFFKRSCCVIDWFNLAQEVFLTQRFSAPFIPPHTQWHPSVSPSVSGIHLYVFKFNKRLELKTVFGLKLGVSRCDALWVFRSFFTWVSFRYSRFHCHTFLQV